jgi:putative (di)nucleoside polyphosphate hydrolase
MKKLYRPNIAGIIMDEDYPNTHNVLLGLRNDMKDIWQFPQGGMNKNENFNDTFYREMKEEIGTDNLKIIDMCPTWLKYDFPYIKNGRYAGQKQKYFLAKLHNNNDININTQKPEFEDYKFVPIKDIFEHISEFKVSIYKEAIAYFQEKGLL